jgi:hypothetical protein
MPSAGKPFSGMPSTVPGMSPPFAGQFSDASQAAQAIAMQQMMSSMALHMTQMQMSLVAAQNQEAKPPAAGASGDPSFLYNALFNAAEGQQGFNPDPPQKGAPSKQRPSLGQKGSPKARTPAKTSGKSGNKMNYNIKNTFVDVPAPTTDSPIAGMRSVQSAAARLYAAAGDGSPQQVTQDDLSPYCDEFSVPHLPPFSTPDHTTLSPAIPPSIGITLEHGYGLNPRMPRGNTWASDLDALAEEAGEDAEGNCNGLSEKRLQDTPLGYGWSSAAYMQGEGEAREDDEDALGMHNLSVKNTFIEYKQKPALGMLRQVQSAAGGLDLMSQD